MNFLRHFSVAILSGFLIFAACSNDDQKSQNSANDQNSPDSISTDITSQQLLSASLEGNLDYVQKALKQDVNINKQDPSGRTPLMLASYNGHAEVVRFLLENKADPNTADNQGRTPLIFAASGSFPETVETLLENGAEPNKVDEAEGWSPLMWAAAEGNEQVVNVLLNHGADPTLEDKDKETARDFASNNGHSKVAELLKQAEDNR